jgi:hypothetical protein
VMPLASTASTQSSSADASLASLAPVEHGLTALSWSDCPFENPKLVVGGYTCFASVWTQEGGKWMQVQVSEQSLDRPRLSPRCCVSDRNACWTAIRLPFMMWPGRQ